MMEEIKNSIHTNDDVSQNDNTTDVIYKELTAGDILHTNLDNMNWINKLSYDAESSKKLRKQAINAISTAIRAETQDLEHTYALNTSYNQIIRHDKYQSAITQIQDKITLDASESTFSIIEKLEEKVIHAKINNHKIKTRYQQLLKDGIIDQAEYEKSISSYFSMFDEAEVNVKKDLISMFAHQRKNLRTSLKNFIDGEIKKNKLIN